MAPIVTPPGTAVATLVIDLDDTLVRTDLLFEQILRLCKSNPRLVMRLPIWIIGGRAEFKRKLAEHVSLDPARLPYRQPVVQLIKRARENGQRVVLASASHERIVAQVAEHLGDFDDVIATSSANLKGATKLKAIEDHVAGKPFVYAGDSSADLVIWQRSAQAIAINPSPSVARRLAKVGVPHEVVRDRVPLIRPLIKQLRIHQWLKNILLFLPFLAAHHFRDWERWGLAALAAAAFSLLASAVYVMNDLLDVDSDRAHHAKSKRPFASGDLPLKVGFLLMPLLLGAASLLAGSLDGLTQAYLTLYFVLNVAYSLRLKEVVLVDTMTLAGFYTLRILAGGSATSVPVSDWLLAFSIFFFFGLALVKRYTELTHGRGKATIAGRGYVYNDKQTVFVNGIASSYLAVLVSVLYLNGSNPEHRYTEPQYLWMLAPVLLYWSSRIWLLAQRGEVHDDPVIFAIKDPVSWMCALVVFGILALAI